jgi:hypothetical protein
MAKRFFLRFLLRNQEEDLIVEVREQQSDRLTQILDGLFDSPNCRQFFWFDTVDGRSIVLNLADVQAVRCLWDPAAGPADSTRFDGGIQICLRGRAEVLEEYTEEPDQLFDLFTNLELGDARFPTFDDVDGEPVYLNADEVVWISAPTHLIEEGRGMVAKEDGLPGPGEAS